MAYVICTALVIAFGAMTLHFHRLVNMRGASQTLTDDGTERDNPFDAAYTKMLLSGGVLLLSFSGLALLVARDIGALVGGRAGALYYDEDEVNETSRNALYEQADTAWNNNDYLEAIRLLRLYLQQNPREQHATLRIAEIYEKDLGNYLAAALELEEVLKQRLKPDRWGWTAIRLSNLYTGKLNQSAKAIALLNRLVEEYPQTGAAEKARKRLAMMNEAEGGLLQEETNVS
jgi:tetratricopeptide (TPR) repeat protein